MDLGEGSLSRRLADARPRRTPLFVHPGTWMPSCLPKDKPMPLFITADQVTESVPQPFVNDVGRAMKSTSLG